MHRNIIVGTFIIAFLSSFAAADDHQMPPVSWGEAAADVIDKPYLCRGPLAVGDGIDVHICTMPAFSRDTLVNFYFVDGSYACFEVTMETTGLDGDQVLRVFDGLVEQLDDEIGLVAGRDSVPNGKPRATWLTEDETIRAAVQSSGSTPLIGIVGLAETYHQRIARLVHW